MVNKNLVGRCGLYCGTCITYRAGKNSKQLQRIIAEKAKCNSKEIRCEGCQTVSKDGWNVKSEEWGKNCKIIKCLAVKK